MLKSSNSIIISDNMNITPKMDSEELQNLIANTDEEFQDLNQLYTKYPQDIHLFLLENKMIKGYLNASPEPNEISINVVGVHSSSRGKKMCKEMIKELISYIENTRGTDKYTLSQVGGISACKCYVNAFKEMGYAAHDFIKNKEFNSEECNNEHVSFIFTKITNGGRKNKTRIKKRSNKRKSIKY